MFVHPEAGRVERWDEAVWDEDAAIVTYDTYYRILAEDRTIAARSRIAFPSRAGIAAQIAAAGLAVERWMGGWDGRSCTQDAPEIIPFGRLV